MAGEDPKSILGLKKGVCPAGGRAGPGGGSQKHFLFDKKCFSTEGAAWAAEDIKNSFCLTKSAFQREWTGAEGGSQKHFLFGKKCFQWRGEGGGQGEDPKSSFCLTKNAFEREAV